MGGIEFLKGHGTENDFVVLPDLNNQLDLTPGKIATLCDRQRGLGADGILRVVRTDAMDTATGATSTESASEWFMDYRNADGSIAEMCGNGVRVFAKYLVEAGLVSQSEFVVGTRAGDREVVVHPDGSVTVHMGPTVITGTSVTTVGDRGFSGVSVEVGNPHLVSVVDGDVADLDLRTQPDFDHEFFPEGVNIEFVQNIDENLVRMRVYERGVGETRACGTGTVAAVAALTHLAGKEDGAATVEIPGGRVSVTVRKGASTLTGPAEIVAHGEIRTDWWEK